MEIYIFTIKLPSVVTLGKASPVDQPRHVICCSGRQACSSGGVRYSWGKQRYLCVPKPKSLGGDYESASA